MPGIEFLKDWDPKKHGWPALLVAVLWITYEVLSPLIVPKDPSCLDDVKYLRTVIASSDKRAAQKDSLNFELERELLSARRIIKVTDSTYREKVIKPAKVIVEKYHHDHTNNQ